VRAASAQAAGGGAGKLPRKSGRLLVTAILLFPVILFGGSAVRAVLLAHEGEVPAGLRDLDCDGRVRAMEWLRGGIDFRLRARADGCQELVHAKTGQVFVVRCAAEPRCRLQVR
jgi:hypothetical protein